MEGANGTLAVYQKIADPMVFAERVGQSLQVAFGLNSPHHGVIMAITCQAENLSFSDYMKRYHADGTMRATAIQAEFQSRGGRIVWTDLGENGAAAAEFSHPKHQPNPLQIAYTLNDARRQVGDKMTKPGSNWATNPSAMLRAALIRKAVKIIDPGIIAGYDDFNDLDIDVVPAVAVVHQVESRRAELEAADAAARTAVVEEDIPDAAIEIPVSEPSPIADKPVVDPDPEQLCTNDQLQELVALGKKLPGIADKSRGMTLQEIADGVRQACTVKEPQHAKRAQIDKLIAKFRSRLSTP